MEKEYKQTNKLAYKLTFLSPRAHSIKFAHNPWTLIISFPCPHSSLITSPHKKNTNALINIPQVKLEPAKAAVTGIG